MTLLILSPGEIEPHLDRIRDAAAATQATLRHLSDNPLAMMRQMKFDRIGQHPVSGHALNLVEQINQTWTYIAALHATRKLFELHPDQDGQGFVPAPGAHAAQPLDLMSVKPGLIGAETFAAVTPSNNGKLLKDIKKLEGNTATHRYVFFLSPAYPTTALQPHLQRDDSVQVWSVSL